jgi:hypothetical protein
MAEKTPVIEPATGTLKDALHQQRALEEVLHNAVEGPQRVMVGDKEYTVTHTNGGGASMTPVESEQK